MKSLKSISASFRNFHDKIMCSFSLIVLGTLKYDCFKKTSGVSNFLLLKNNSLTTGLNFLLDSISAVISSNTINTFLFFVGL